MTATIQILHHGNCFDGVVSAAIFSRFFLDGPHAGARITYRGMSHGPHDPYGEDHDRAFFAEVNAVADFRYSPSPKLTWFCDHHQTSFLKPEDRAHFEADRSGRRCFDPSAPSCAGLLRRWLSERHGLPSDLFEEHVRWADLIDSARFETPAQAVELREPALQLMALLESATGAGLSETLIAGLVRGTLEDLHAHPRVQQALVPVLADHERTVEIFRTRMAVDQGVAYCDASAEGVEGFNKFIPYYLVAGLRYTVVLTCSPGRAKVSVGSNPWDRPEPLENLGALCQRYGGGGHAVVGAVSFAPSDLEAARRASLEITSILRR
jgi:hypothetical protein